jgi:hypothetical protein
VNLSDIRNRAAALANEISIGLKAILAEPLPDDFRTWLIALGPRESVLSPLGLPTAIVEFVSADHSFSRAVSAMCARRVYYTLRHVHESLLRVPPGCRSEVNQETLNQPSKFLSRLVRYVPSSRTSLEGLKPILLPRAKFGSSETMVDSDVFLVIRLYLAYLARIQDAGKDMDGPLVEATMTYLETYLRDVVEGREKPMDGATPSWAFAILADSRPAFVLKYAERYLTGLPVYSAPQERDQAGSITPEIYTDFRTHCLVLCNHARVLRALRPYFLDTRAYALLRDRTLDVATDVVRGCPDDCHLLYHKVSGIEALCAAEELVEYSAVESAFKRGWLCLDSHSVLPGYVCTTRASRERLEHLQRDIQSQLAKKTQVHVLIAGPSSAGKSRLVEALAYALNAKLVDTIKRPTADGISTLLERMHQAQKRPELPAALIDECDVPQSDGVFEALFSLVQGGGPGAAKAPERGCFFYVVSTYPKAESFGDELRQHAIEARWRKGSDWFTRLDVRFDHGGDEGGVFRLLLIAASEAVRQRGEPVNLDFPSVLEIVGNPNAVPRDIEKGVERLSAKNGVWTSPDRVPRACVTITKQRGRPSLTLGAVAEALRKKFSGVRSVSTLTLLGPEKLEENLRDGFSEVDVVAIVPGMERPDHAGLWIRLQDVFAQIASALTSSLGTRVLVESRIGPHKPESVGPGDLVLHALVYSPKEYFCTSELVQFAWRNAEPLIGVKWLRDYACPESLRPQSVLTAPLGIDECTQMLEGGFAWVRSWGQNLERTRLQLGGRSQAQLFSYCALRSSCNVSTLLGAACERYEDLATVRGDWCKELRVDWEGMLEFRKATRTAATIDDKALEAGKAIGAGILKKLRALAAKQAVH